MSEAHSHAGSAPADLEGLLARLAEQERRISALEARLDGTPQAHAAHAEAEHAPMAAEAPPEPAAEAGQAEPEADPEEPAFPTAQAEPTAEAAAAAPPEPRPAEPEPFAPASYVRPRRRRGMSFMEQVTAIFVFLLAAFVTWMLAPQIADLFGR